MSRPDSIHVYSLDSDGRMEARDMTVDEAEMALRLHMLLVRLPNTEDAT